jgi:hypothetical protein
MLRSVSLVGACYGNMYGVHRTERYASAQNEPDQSQPEWADEQGKAPSATLLLNSTQFQLNQPQL